MKKLPRGKFCKGYVTPGLLIDNIVYEQSKKQNSTRGTKTEDTINRDFVVNKILKYVDEGMTEDDAIEKVVKQQEIIDKFPYIKANKLDFKTCFKNWVEGRKKSKEYNKRFELNEEERS